MKIYIEGHSFNYELEKLCRIFLPFEKIEFVNEKSIADAGVTLKSGEVDMKGEVFLSLEGKTERLEQSFPLSEDKEYERELACMLYRCFQRLTGYSSRWGILTGVRPAKLFSSLQKKGGRAYAIDYFENKLLVSPEKIHLCEKAVAGEKEITDLSEERSFSLYVGIPFCPSRCSYCSFVSHSIEKAKKLIPEYVEKLLLEIEETAKIADRCSLKLETVYIGGGTPTSLSAEQLEAVMAKIAECFKIKNAREYTVEAGRPDTITKQKLEVIKRLGGKRISINPQTMSDDILKAIGRRHTAEEAVEAFKLAREVGIDNINMDLIAGLPSDSFEGFKESLERIISLAPESITLHTLCLKRSANLTLGGQIEALKYGEETSKMLDYSAFRLEGLGYFPYYMYRQSKMVGNLENVGYALKGFEGLYNVYIMDETHSILAVGGSAVTKLRRYNESLIERVYNFKYPYEYISRFPEMLQRKQKILEFYGKI